jgi:uncharacterized protein
MMRGAEKREILMNDTKHRAHVAVWFEIPASDLDRAQDFYEAILGTKMERMQMGEADMAVFPYEQPNVSGSIIAAPEFAGKSNGTPVGPIVYINCDGKLDTVAERVEAAGGKLMSPRVQLPGDMGAFFQIRDTEGNRVGIHAVV